VGTGTRAHRNLCASSMCNSNQHDFSCLTHLVLWLWTGQETQGRGRLQDLAKRRIDGFKDGRRAEVRRLRRLQGQASEGEEDSRTWQRRFKDTVGRGRRGLQTWQRRSGEGEEDSRTRQRRFKDTASGEG